MLTGGRIVALAALFGVVLAGCASASSEPPDAEAKPTIPADTQAETEIENPEAVGAISPRRVLALELRPESEVLTNPLPSVELHDVGQDRMVNFRNIFPAEQPVLLWMWAPF